MGETTALQKSELDVQRQALRARVRRFRDQVERDKETVGDELSRLVGSESPMAQHPKALVGVSAGVGVALGLAPAKVPVPELPHPSGLAAKATNAGVNALKVEAGVVLRDILAGMFGGSDHDGDPSPDVTRQRQIEGSRGGG